MARISANIGADTDAPDAISNYTFAYTTDDPGVTAGDSITIADGDAITAAETMECLEDLAGKINTILAALRQVGIIES